MYHNLGLGITSAAPLLGVPVSQYINDRHVGQLFPQLAGTSLCTGVCTSFQSACRDRCLYYVFSVLYKPVTLLVSVNRNGSHQAINSDPFSWFCLCFLSPRFLPTG